MLTKYFLRRPKIFCIGRNKTGTTSLQSALHDFGYRVGDQAVAELMMDDWAKREFHRIVAYCKTADAFQDVPFSLDYTYQILDYAYPGSKFILTVRNSADEWYESLVRFHGRIMKVSGVPTADDLKNCSYRGMGWLWKQQQHVYGVDETTLYDEKIYKEHYLRHCMEVQEYFRYRPDDLLVINLSDSSAMKALCTFLGIEYIGQGMPHLNRSKK